MNVDVVVVRREHQHACLAIPDEQPLQRGQPADAGHRHIHHHHVGIAFGVQTHRTFAVVGLGNDLGAGPFQAFRDVTWPLVRSSVLVGGLLAFALSFDEIVVTTFTAGPTVQTLPIWIFGNLFRPNQAPVINVVAAALTIVAIIPVWLAQRCGGDPATTRV